MTSGLTAFSRVLGVIYTEKSGLATQDYDNKTSLAIIVLNSNFDLIGRNLVHVISLVFVVAQKGLLEGTAAVYFLVANYTEYLFCGVNKPSL